MGVAVMGQSLHRFRIITFPASEKGGHFHGSKKGKGQMIPQGAFEASDGPKPFQQNRRLAIGVEIPPEAEARPQKTIRFETRGDRHTDF
jgi:hypothetical protein